MIVFGESKAIIKNYPLPIKFSQKLRINGIWMNISEQGLNDYNELIETTILLWKYFFKKKKNHLYDPLVYYLSS